MLSNTCKTAIKAVIYLATRDQAAGKASIKEISDFIGASEHTVGKFLQTLVKQGIINSSKGPAGGFYLAEAQREQPVIDIVTAIDGMQFFRECGLGLNQCSALHPCPIHFEYMQARNLIEKLFREKQVKDLCEPVSLGLAHLIS